LVDAQEFEHLSFPRALFTPRLLEHLCRDAGRTVMLECDFVHVRHCYVERRVTPLNLYVREADAWRTVQAQHRAGVMLFITPYEESRRLRRGTPSA